MYDSIIIGTGPLSLIEALYLHQQGRKVLVLEKGTRPGGAWGTVESGVLPALEIGCHIWDVDKAVFTFLRELTGITLKPLKPQPRIYSGSLRVPYDWKNLIFMARETAGALKQASLGKAGRAMGKGMKKGSRIFPAKYLYPSGGAAELCDGLMRLIRQAGISIQYDTPIRKIDLSGDGVTVYSGDKSFEAKELAITTFSELEEVTDAQGTVHAIGLQEPRAWIHYHLRYEDATDPNFSYIRLMRHPLIHRISDITQQLDYHQYETKNERIILAGIHANAFPKHSEEERREQITSTLRRYRLIGKEAKLLEAEHNTYVSRYLGGKELDELLELCSGKVRSLHSTNLIYGIRKQLHRWKTLTD